MVIASRYVSKIFCVGLLFFLLFLPSLANSQNGAKLGVREAYKLDSGDRLRVTVFEEPDLSGDFEVDGLGTISLPLIGEVKVGNLTLREAEKTIETRFLAGYLKRPQVSIDVLNYRPFYILGEVKDPGSYPFVSGITVLNAVAMAGGFTYRAREERLVIIRGDDPTKREQAGTPDTLLLPGDIVKVQERFF